MGTRHAATAEDRLAAARLRKGEPWFEGAYPAFEAWLAGTADFDPAIEPFFYGSWDAVAAQHCAPTDEQCNDEAAELYFSEGAFDPAATLAALAELPAPALVLAGELDGGPGPTSPAAPPTPSARPSWRCSRAPGTIRGSTTRRGSCAGSARSSKGEGYFA